MSGYVITSDGDVYLLPEDEQELDLWGPQEVSREWALGEDDEEVLA